MRVIGDDLLGGLVDLFPDAQIRGTPPAVIRAVGATLVFLQFEQGGIPAVAAQTGRIIDWQTQVVADFRARYALKSILVEARTPLARGVHLCRRGRHRAPQCGGEYMR